MSTSGTKKSLLAIRSIGSVIWDGFSLVVGTDVGWLVGANGTARQGQGETHTCTYIYCYSYLEVCLSLIASKFWHTSVERGSLSYYATWFVLFKTMLQWVSPSLKSNAFLCTAHTVTNLWWVMVLLDKETFEFQEDIVIEQ